MKSDTMGTGGMGEWLKPAVLKTVSGVTRSGVRIPLPPPGLMDAKNLGGGIWMHVRISRGPVHYALVVGSVRFCRLRPQCAFVPTQTTCRSIPHPLSLSV